jgi:2',3'-cyclic-nucleotide 2'-phosphodiesterase (5'-nucleotidase family)
MNMKRILSALLLVSIFVSISGQEEKKIVILHTNDLHSRLNGFSPESDYSPLITENDKTKGGFKADKILQTVFVREENGRRT